MIQHNDYLERITAWLPYARQYFYQPSDREDLLCYGVGYDSWGVQTNQKAFTAFAVAGVMNKEESTVDEALRLLRFCLETHIEGSYACTDGRKWGHTWISALGTERMMHGVEAVRTFLSDSDMEMLRRVLLSEADWLLNDYNVTAGLKNSSGRNRPESNLWNGAFLYRTSLLYPDSPNSKSYQDMAFDFFINSISVPEDESSEIIYDGKQIAPYFKGANFFPSYALNHHGYLNVGYMVICLSQIAMLHLWCKERGFSTPEALYHHAGDLWRLVKTLTFSDGRLMRIGGDTRARYCYCQDYLIPSWLFLFDKYGDTDVLSLEAGWLSQLSREQDHNGDGGFISKRGADLKAISQLYYTRLDSDRACSLSMGAWWRKNLDCLQTETPEIPSEINRYPKFRSWMDAYHGSFVHENKGVSCSFTWEAAEGPTALYLPSKSSDMAEWRHNLSVHVKGEGAIQTYKVMRKDVVVFEGGALTSGCYDICEDIYITEGENEKVLARVNLLYALLPDSRTALLIQHAICPRRASIEEVRGLFLQIPNDIWNNNSRSYTWESDSRTLSGFGADMETINIPSNWIDIDKSIYLERIYGPEGFSIFRPGHRQIGFKKVKASPYSYEQGMLYCDEICGEFVDKKRFFDTRELIADSAYVLRPSLGTGTARSHVSFRVDASQGFRSVGVTAEDGVRYIAVLPVEDKNSTVLLIDGIAQGTLYDMATGRSFSISNNKVELGNLHTGKIFRLTVS